MTVLQRTDLTTSQKIQCAAAAVAGQHAHGSKTALSERYEILRPRCTPLGRRRNRCFAAILKRRCSRVRRWKCGSMTHSFAERWWRCVRSRPTPSICTPHLLVLPGQVSRPWRISRHSRSARGKSPSASATAARTTTESWERCSVQARSARRRASGLNPRSSAASARPRQRASTAVPSVPSARRTRTGPPPPSPAHTRRHSATVSARTTEFMTRR